MTNWFEILTPVAQALLATLFTWGVTVLGAVMGFVRPHRGRRTRNCYAELSEAHSADLCKAD